MKILCVLHAVFEKPGSIEKWAKKRGHTIDEVRPYDGEKMPDIRDYDFLVLMGGPQSPFEMDQAPYLKDEIALIKNAINKHKRIIGVCLGAQLIAEALGAKTERSPNREIGMYPLELTYDAHYDPIFRQFGKKFNVMHWHNDMPGIPEDAVLLAKSAGCPQQIFRYGDRIYGLQCHFELTRKLIEEMIACCPGDLKSGEYVMTPKELMEIDCDQINLKLDTILDYLASLPERILKNRRVP